MRRWKKVLVFVKGKLIGGGEGETDGLSSKVRGSSSIGGDGVCFFFL